MNSLVSSLYRQAPSEGYGDPILSRKRIQKAVDRLSGLLGAKEVRRRIRESSGNADVKARLILMTSGYE